MADATQLSASGRGVAGSAFFTGGMSSASDPIFIDDRAYRHGENVLNRGGAVRTRPGYRQIFTLPSGNLQGAEYFRPISGEGYVVVAIDGKLYSSPYPFLSYTQIPNIQLFQYAERVFFSVTTVSAVHNADGTIQATEPVRMLIAQDNAYTRAAYWDGVASGHIDPTVTSDSSGNILQAGTPLGGPVQWSGDRLWVARGNKLFAGDIDDPKSFTENEYLGEGGFFAFDDDVVAMAEIPSLQDPVLVIFTKTRTYQILSSIRDRTLWKSIPNFKSTVFPDIGCVNQRAITSHNGVLWWFTTTGLTNLNSASQARVSSKLVPQDAPMAVSKSNISPDLSKVALGSYENFLLCSVPYGGKLNTHTWVYDESVIAPGGSQSSEAWAGVWTGTRPVEWVGGLFGGTPRMLYVSTDYDGANRLWEAFVPDQTDNGSRIQSFVETKTHIDFSQRATGLDKKTFLFAELAFTDVIGTLDISAYWAGTRGKYKKLADTTIVASTGSLNTGTLVTFGTGVQTNRSQTRTLRFPDVIQDPKAACSSLGIESKNGDWVDVGFSLLVKWTGRGALRSYRIFADPYQEPSTGYAAVPETGPNVVSGAICP